jgi:hypothetical protein
VECGLTLYSKVGSGFESKQAPTLLMGVVIGCILAGWRAEGKKKHNVFRMAFRKCPLGFGQLR